MLTVAETVAEGKIRRDRIGRGWIEWRATMTAVRLMVAAVLAATSIVGTGAAVSASTSHQPTAAAMESRPAVRAAGTTVSMAPAAARTLTRGTRVALPSAHHSAFPGAVRLPDGRLLVVWRQASGHLTFDGRLFESTSADNGRTWTPEVLTLYAPGFDLRDPALTLIDGQVWMTLCTSQPGHYGNGVYVTHSPDGTAWSTPARVDDGLPRAGESGPLVQLADGRLLQAFYGHPAGETRDSMYAATSPNGGTTWTSVRVLNGQIDGRDYVEPFTLSTATGQVRAFLRWGATEQIGTVTFTGTAWVGAHALWNGSGRPSCVPNGHNVLCIYRNTDPDRRVGMMRLSTNDGDSFGPAQLFDGSGYLFTYAQPVTSGRGWVVPYAVQTSGTSTTQGASAVYARTVNAG